MNDAKYLTQELNGHWFGHYGLAFCPAHDNTNTPALSIKNAESGALLSFCHAGCTYTDVQAALRNIGLLPNEYSLSAPVQKRRVLNYSNAPTSDQRIVAANHARYAATMWRSALPIADTFAARYLKNRFISCPLPPTLRFMSNCPHPKNGTLPAMLARVDGAIGFSLHRTYLANGGLGKTKVQPNKAMLGSCKGGAVHLSSSQIHTEGGPLVVTEGIENGLSLLSGLLDEPATVWAALSTSGIISLNLPRKPGHLIIAADGDDAGQCASRKLSMRAVRLGWRVSHLTPPNGSDWNDLLVRIGGIA